MSVSTITKNKNYNNNSSTDNSNDNNNDSNNNKSNNIYNNNKNNNNNGKHIVNISKLTRTSYKYCFPHYSFCEKNAF